MDLIMKLTIAYLEAMKVKYKTEKDNIISLTASGLQNKTSLEVLVTFDDDANTLALKTKEYASFGENQKTKIYEVCARANALYRWAKFYPDEENNTVIIAADAIVDFDSCGEELMQLVHNVGQAADEAFPEFMQVMWLE